MNLKKLGLAGLLFGLAGGVSACTDGYGYSGVGVGYGAGYGGYYDDGFGYGDPYGGYGYGYDNLYGGGFGGGYFGWYNGFYYPGTGYYVYDRYRRPYRWNGVQQRYWQDRLNRYRGADRRDNWSFFNRGDRQALGNYGRRADPYYDRRTQQGARQEYRSDVQDARRDYRAGTIDRGQFRERRIEAGRDYRRDTGQRPPRVFRRRDR